MTPKAETADLMAAQLAARLADGAAEAHGPGVRGERNGVSRLVGLAAVIALLITGAATFMILIGMTPIAPNGPVVTAALTINSLLAGVLIFLIGREIVVLILARRKGRAAARLHVRIISLFALVAAIPAILVAIVASITLDLGLDRWFEMRTKQIVGSSVSVARAYMDESRRTLTGNTISMAFELDRARQIYSLDRPGFESLLTLQAKGRGFIAAQLLRRNGEVVMEAELPREEAMPPAREEFFVAADGGDPVAIPPGNTNLIGAMFKLREIPNVYLYAIMPIRPEVIQQLRLMEENTAKYAELEQNRLPVQLAFAVLYVGVCLIVLLSAIWMGISVADRVVAPIRRLITAADEVSQGNLDVQVGTMRSEGDLKNLGDTFNKMISELRSQRNEILQAKDDIDQRARFTEAVLSGVTAAVIGVSAEGKITIANSSACQLLETEAPQGRSLKRLSSELAQAFKNARRAGKREYREQVTFWRNGAERTLNVQVTMERGDGSAGALGHSFVITIDDITDLVSAQRSTAWSDVARRIAHEIKNPLTPIQLSAERIRRRYGKYIVEDREIFDQCTDTIIRQVGDIGRMVDEFSSFARMPKPVMEKTNLAETLGEAVFLQKVGNPAIEFVTDFGPEPLVGRFDTRLLSQAFINILKNAAEAIESKDRSSTERGRIEVRARREDGRYVVDFIDNGRGLPKENRQRLLEPYMTTREKGTGLGLAIVRKVLEDHGGSIELLDAPQVATGGQGAMMRLVLPAEEMNEDSLGDGLAGGRAGSGQRARVIG